MSTANALAGIDVNLLLLRYLAGQRHFVGCNSVLSEATSVKLMLDTLENWFALRYLEKVNVAQLSHSHPSRRIDETYSVPRYSRPASIPPGIVENSLLLRCLRESVRIGKCIYR